MPCRAAGAVIEATPRPGSSNVTVATTEPRTMKSTDPFAAASEDTVIVVSNVALAPPPLAAGPPQRSVPAGAAAGAPEAKARRDTTRATDAVPKTHRRDFISLLPCRERVERTEIPRLILAERPRYPRPDDHHAHPGHPSRNAGHRALRARPAFRPCLFRVHDVSTHPAPHDGSGDAGRPAGPPVGALRPRPDVRSLPEEDVPGPVRGALPRPDLRRVHRPDGPHAEPRLRGPLPAGGAAVLPGGVLGGLPPPEGRRPRDDSRRRRPRARTKARLQEGAPRPELRRRPDPRAHRVPDGERPGGGCGALRAAREGGNAGGRGGGGCGRGGGNGRVRRGRKNRRGGIREMGAPDLLPFQANFFSFPLFPPGDVLRRLVGAPRRDPDLRQLPAVREALPRHHGPPEPLLREDRPAREDGDVRHRESGRDGALRRRPHRGFQLEAEARLHDLHGVRALPRDLPDASHG